MREGGGERRGERRERGRESHLFLKARSEASDELIFPSNRCLKCGNQFFISLQFILHLSRCIGLSEREREREKRGGRRGGEREEEGGEGRREGEKERGRKKGKDGVKDRSLCEFVLVYVCGSSLLQLILHLSPLILKHT